MKTNPAVWKMEFEAAGYVSVLDLLAPAQVRTLQEALDRITSDLGAAPPHLRSRLHLESAHVGKLGGRADLRPEDCGEAVRSISDLALFDPVFASLIGHPPLLEVLEGLFGSKEFAFWFLEGRPKAARVGHGFAWHRKYAF